MKYYCSERGYNYEVPDTTPAQEKCHVCFMHDLEPAKAEPITSDPAPDNVRYCPECGHVGDIEPGYLACCPDSKPIYTTEAEARVMHDNLMQEIGSRHDSTEVERNE